MRGIWERPSVLLALEHHGTRYFNATTEKDFLKSAVRILRERFDEGLYPENIEHAIGGRPSSPDLSDSIWCALNYDSTTYKTGKSQRDRIVLWDREKDNYIAWRIKAVKALADNDGYAAWGSLIRRTADDEQVELEALE
jgi:hypothetical protein